MKIHCVLGTLKQRVHSEAMRGSSKINDKIVSTQHRLHGSTANMKAVPDKEPGEHGPQHHPGFQFCLPLPLMHA